MSNFCINTTLSRSRISRLWNFPLEIFLVGKTTATHARDVTRVGGVKGLKATADTFERELRVVLPKNIR